MPRETLRFAAIFAASLLAPSLQMPAQGVPPQEHAGFVNGITFSSIPGVPFSATAVLEYQRDWPDGSTSIRRTINLIARDSQGRTHNETRRLMPEYFHGSPELISVHLFDPITRIRTIYNPTLHTAHQQFVPETPKIPAIPSPLIHEQDLGTTALNGLPAKGTRRTFTVSASASGTGSPVEIEDEYWYSEDLQMNLLVRHSDPRTGVQTIGISNLKREEPPATMFQVPQGYRIFDVGPPAPASPASEKPPAQPIP